ncbi:hypothetical protein ND861_11565 [Leptospira sp. 2 VSF19]|uniref:Galactose oxidase n=1 Tax=Leptospira soteropolitanensis TaxID=2950025 RepID=A0AAW5VJZ9_9LEPT|nr:hypothetical protein [Leptospira soteropolitanensis]MCW7493057.1 hypothetical protein [Leptospira soteropolitanensis]MCW7500873.1 hypothetical protein [Leptospira soteropolitanensis]MCW7522908.1 hypothetical protein [Leptospira soteropolitanensis]MCW7526986.1 hypothetical protein [Leptospira soteropolitanensis]MCW7530626.1 hypothetical protein [Leptospira soteropolitanensis]
MGHIKITTKVFNRIIVFFSLLLLFHCRVNPNPKGSMLNPKTPDGLFNSILLFALLNNGPTRDWTSFPSPFGTPDPTDSLVFDQIGITTYAIYIRNSIPLTRIYSSTDGTTYTQFGDPLNNFNNANIFAAFTGRFQLSNYHSPNVSGTGWTTSIFDPGFCLVKYNGTSAYLPGDGFVDRTTDSGGSFNRITSSPAYPSRTSGSCVYANGKTYILGGKNGSSNLFDFWESTDGIIWALITERIKQTSGGGINRPCNAIQNTNDTSVLGMVYSDVTAYKFHVVFNNLALLQSNDGKTWTCTNPNLTFNYGFNSIANRAVLIGKRLFVYGQTDNVYTDLE